MENIQLLTCSLNELRKAYNKCKKSVSWKDSVINFGMLLLPRVISIRNDIANGVYEIQKYQRFNIYEPKKRKIVSTRIRDRVFQKSLCDNYLYKQITKSFIYDNCACQIGKGTDFARKRLKRHLEHFIRRNGNSGYVLQCDIENFYGSIDHETAKKILREHIKDNFAYNNVAKIIDSYEVEEGIGLGSQISQLIALAMLNKIDHIIKEKLKVKEYVRYADDLVLLLSNKEEAITALETIKIALSSENLTLNEKKTKIYKLTQCIHFLGFRYFIKSLRVYLSCIRWKITRAKRRIRKQFISGYPLEQLKDNIKNYMKYLFLYKSYKDMFIIEIYLKDRRISYAS